MPSGDEPTVHEPRTLAMTLGENSLDSLVESLEKVRMAEASDREWKFAIVHVVHSIELMLKERLQREHPLLVFQNVDRPGTTERPGATVSLETALTRLQNAGVTFDPKDVVAITKAIEWRNKITHHEFAHLVIEVRSTYALLFEFIHTFQLREMQTDVTASLAPGLAATAADIMQVFRQEFVTFDGQVVHRSWPRALVVAQKVSTVYLNGRPYARIRYGDEPIWKTQEFQSRPMVECHDCAAVPGQFHGPGCDMEECPRCHGQFLSCDCEDDVDVPDDMTVRRRSHQQKLGRPPPTSRGQG